MTQTGKKGYTSYSTNLLKAEKYAKLALAYPKHLQYSQNIKKVFRRKCVTFKRRMRQKSKQT